jgi:hypothetical protein
MTNSNTFELSASEWQEIVQFSDLPAVARPMIENSIALFRAFERAGGFSAAETRKNLHELHELVMGLHSRLAVAIANPEVHGALTVQPTSSQRRNSMPEQRFHAHLRLASSLFALTELADWLRIAKDRVKRRKPGAFRKAENIQ